jgi:hypothetical protein
MANPLYEEDLALLKPDFSLSKLLSPQTTFIVVGTTLLAELFDRSFAERLQDEVNRRNGFDVRKRAFILVDRIWMEEAWLHEYGCIAVGGPMSNQYTRWLMKNVDPAAKESLWPFSPGLNGFVLCQKPPIAVLWGQGVEETRDAVERFISMPEGMIRFLDQL